MFLAGIQRFKLPDKRSGTVGSYIVVVLTSGVLLTQRSQRHKERRENTKKLYVLCDLCIKYPVIL
ncbi:hypothetical protein MNBD_GAMMA19-1775 [hydrothermal vent metagenome]|uniref:Uncharacterized protein n=1 Tax=hydrothermal vent metagenome TaxID=652676 RepID=A0A3B1BAJ0_9ZZZZ